MADFKPGIRNVRTLLESYEIKIEESESVKKLNKVTNLRRKSEIISNFWKTSLEMLNRKLGKILRQNVESFSEVVCKMLATFRINFK